MNREEAAAVLMVMVNRLDDFNSLNGLKGLEMVEEGRKAIIRQDALRVAIASLREPARKPCGWCNDGVMQIVDSPNKPPIRSNYCGLCGRKLTAPPRPGAIGPDAGEMDPNGDEGEES